MREFGLRLRDYRFEHVPAAVGPVLGAGYAVEDEYGLDCFWSDGLLAARLSMEGRR